MRKILLLLFVIPVPAVGQPYFSIGSGLNAASELESVRSGPDFGGSLCDEYMNPRYDELPECTGPPNPEGRAWISLFDRATGVLGAAAIGYRAGGWLRGELEYYYRDSAYDQSSLIMRPSGEASERAGGEIGRAREHVYSLTSHNLFGNIYIDFDTGSLFTPYLGVGVGAGFTDLDNGRMVTRFLDPAAFTGVPDHLSNADEIRRNLAGTTTAVLTTETDTMTAYQVLFGSDLALSEPVSLGFKGRWVWYGTFQGRGVLDQLRSHPPNYRRDGSLPLSYNRRIEGVQMVGVTVELKYEF